MDRLKQMQTYVAVATRGSLTAAATAEGVAPAIIGRRIDALEARLGIKLMIRTTRKLSLTREGEAFLEDCQRLLAEVDAAEAAVSAGGARTAGHLRITAPAGFGRRHVAPLVPRFLASHPEVSLSLDLSDRVVDLVNEVGRDAARYYCLLNSYETTATFDLELAKRRGFALATLDEKLRQAGKSLKVTVLP